jgi:hypothetical protein
VTCGVLRQGERGRSPQPEDAGRALVGLGFQMVLRNLELLGNCLGAPADLGRAVEDHCAGRFPVLIDSIFSGTDVGAFLDRSFNAPDRLGKVVYRFDSDAGAGADADD